MVHNIYMLTCPYSNKIINTKICLLLKANINFSLIVVWIHRNLHLYNRSFQNLYHYIFLAVMFWIVTVTLVNSITECLSQGPFSLMSDTIYFGIYLTLEMNCMLNVREITSKGFGFSVRTFLWESMYKFQGDRMCSRTFQTSDEHFIFLYFIVIGPLTYLHAFSWNGLA